MVKKVSDALKRAVLSGESEKVPVILLEINLKDGSEILLSSNNEDTVSRGRTFKASSFSATLPDEIDTTLPRIRLQIPTIDLEIIKATRSQDERLLVTVYLVLADTPDVYERNPFKVEMTNVSFDETSMSAVLQPPSFLNDPYPSRKYRRRDYPGLR